MHDSGDDGRLRRLLALSRYRTILLCYVTVTVSTAWQRAGTAVIGLTTETLQMSNHLLFDTGYIAFSRWQDWTFMRLSTTF
jgi:hypothetical protein